MTVAETVGPLWPSDVLSLVFVFCPQEDGNGEAEEEEEDSDQFIEVSVVEPVKIGDGMSSYMAYKVITKTNVSYFKWVAAVGCALGSRRSLKNVIHKDCKPVIV